MNNFTLFAQFGAPCTTLLYVSRPVIPKCGQSKLVVRARSACWQISEKRVWGVEWCHCTVIPLSYTLPPNLLHVLVPHRMLVEVITNFQASDCIILVSIWWAERYVPIVSAANKNGNGDIYWSDWPNYAVASAGQSAVRSPHILRTIKTDIKYLVSASFRY